MLHMYFIFGIMACTILLYATEKYPIEIVALCTMSAIIILFTLFPIHSNDGAKFSPSMLLMQSISNSALITVMSMLIIGHAIVISGVFDMIYNHIVVYTKHQTNNSFIGIFLIIACIMSVFINNTTIVIMFIPIFTKLTSELNISNSKIMMPLAFVTSLGGMTTVFGNSTNILIAEEINSITNQHIGVFEFTYPGIILCIIGLVYVLFFMLKRLPDRGLNTQNAANREFVIECKINEYSTLYNKKIEDCMLLHPEIHIKMLHRNNLTFLPPFDGKLTLQNNDILTFIVQKSDTSEVIYKIMGDAEIHKHESSLIEAIIPPNSSIISSKLEYASRKLNMMAIGIQKRARNIKENIGLKIIKPGDIILLLSTKKVLDQYHKDIILLAPTISYLPNKFLIKKVLAIFCGVITLSVFNISPIMINAFIGAVLLILTHCITIKQALKALDYRVFLIISSSYMLSLAMNATGGLDYIANHIAIYAHDKHPVIIMLMLFVIIMLLNEIISNNAVGLIFAPISLKIAHQLHIDPKLFIFGTIFASSCAFMTPIGYQTNLMVMTPGNYTFIDYIKYGAPLSILICVSYILFMYFNMV